MGVVDPSICARWNTTNQGCDAFATTRVEGRWNGNMCIAIEQVQENRKRGRTYEPTVVADSGVGTLSKQGRPCHQQQELQGPCDGCP
mmetsp:Transcript_7276/g.25804  ORF Transcript_7276/g.25804 Transcript_7276/m.25804 type:complete len:87 (+) Transcript_7276:1076-1336(+)